MSVRRVFAYTLSIILIILVWRAIPIIEVVLSSQPKPITPRGSLSNIEKTNISIFENSKDSVVYISTLQTVVDPWSLSVWDIPRGTGSGFVWDKFGHIVTNFHVIKGASSAKVRLSNGIDYEAALVGADPSHDLAVLKIDPVLNVMKPVMIGDSKSLKVGQIVYAIGNPFGLDWTMTTGIISALDRVINEESGAKIKHAIQTDAAINPGNSGGPLLDSAGRVIGVNTAIYSPSGASAGIGFAIPIDLVNRVVSQLIAYGRYIKPSLGIESDDRVNALLKRRYGVEGVAVLSVKVGSSAYKAGLIPSKFYPNGAFEFGDIILSINGKRVKSLEELEEVLSDFSLGDRVVLEVLRGNRKMEIPVILEAGD